MKHTSNMFLIGKMAVSATYGSGLRRPTRCCSTTWMRPLPLLPTPPAQRRTWNSDEGTVERGSETPGFQAKLAAAPNGPALSELFSNRRSTSSTSFRLFTSMLVHTCVFVYIHACIRFIHACLSFIAFIMLIHAVNPFYQFNPFIPFIHPSNHRHSLNDFVRSRIRSFYLSAMIHSPIQRIIHVRLLHSISIHDITRISFIIIANHQPSPSSSS